MKRDNEKSNNCCSADFPEVNMRSGCSISSFIFIKNPTDYFPSGAMTLLSELQPLTYTSIAYKQDNIPLHNIYFVGLKQHFQYVFVGY